MKRIEEQPQTAEGQYICDTTAQFLLKFLALNLEEDDTLSFRDILGRITELEKERPFPQRIYRGSEFRLRKDLEHLETLRLVKAKDEAKALIEAEISVSNLGRYLAALFMTPDALKPVLEAKRQSS